MRYQVWINDKAKTEITRPPYDYGEIYQTWWRNSTEQLIIHCLSWPTDASQERRRTRRFSGSKNGG
jgi:hypothetical protein